MINKNKKSAQLSEDAKETLNKKLKCLFKVLVKSSLAAAVSFCILFVFFIPSLSVGSTDINSSSQTVDTSSSSQANADIQALNEAQQQQALDEQTQAAQQQLPPQTVLDDNAMTDVINSVVQGDTPQTLEILLFLTLITLAPSILIMMTCFTRIIIVLSILKNAMGLQQTPPSQVLVGMALFLSLFIMMPVVDQIKETAYDPYVAKQINAEQALKLSSVPLKTFMMNNTKDDDMQFFIELSGKEFPPAGEETTLGLEIVVPAFITSELKRAFTMGFLLYIPFLVVDIVISSTLMSLGMMMLPPAMVSMPFKIMLFIVADGWKLLFGTIVKGFN